MSWCSLWWEVNSVSLVHTSQASLASAVQGPGVAGMPSPFLRKGECSSYSAKGHFGLHGSQSVFLAEEPHPCVPQPGNHAPGACDPKHPWMEAGEQPVPHTCVLFDLRNLEAFRTWKCSRPGAMQCGGKRTGLAIRSSGLSLSSALAGYVTRSRSPHPAECGFSCLSNEEN